MHQYFVTWKLDSKDEVWVTQLTLPRYTNNFNEIINWARAKEKLGVEETYEVYSVIRVNPPEVKTFHREDY